MYSPGLYIGRRQGVEIRYDEDGWYAELVGVGGKGDTLELAIADSIAVSEEHWQAQQDR
jgi:hypothetical protein